MADWRQMADRVNQSVIKTFRESSPAIYIPAATGVPISVVLFFESRQFEMDVNTTVSHFTERPRVFLRLEDLGRDPADGDTVTVQGTLYIVSHEERDGYGGVTLYLQRTD